MPSAENPFEDVLDDKEWTKQRNKTGLLASLTEKVEMGKELKLFHTKNDTHAALHLLEKIGIYEQVLKNKHSKALYYKKLLKLVEDQKQAVQAGIAAIANAAKVQDENAEKIKEVRKMLNTLSGGVGTWAGKIEDMVQEKEAQDEYKNRFRALSERATELKDVVPRDATTLGNDVVAKVVQLEKDFEQLKADLVDEDDEGDGKTHAQRYWDRYIDSYLAGMIGTAMNAVNREAGRELLAPAVPHAQFLAGLLRPVRDKFAREYDPFVVKVMSDMKPADDLTRGWCDLAKMLVNNAVKEAVEQARSTQWFEYEPQALREPKEKRKKVAMDPTEELTLREKGWDVTTGVRPEETDDTHKFASLLKSVAKFKGDPQKVGRFLQAATRIIFDQQKSMHGPLKKVGAALETGAKNVQRLLERQPPDLDGARASLTETRQAVAQGCHEFPAKGDVITTALEQFALKSLEDEINAKAGG